MVITDCSTHTSSHNLVLFASGTYSILIMSLSMLFLKRFFYLILIHLNPSLMALKSFTILRTCSQFIVKHRVSFLAPSTTQRKLHDSFIVLIFDRSQPRTYKVKTPKVRYII